MNKRLKRRQDKNKITHTTHIGNVTGQVHTGSGNIVNKAYMPEGNSTADDKTGMSSESQVDVVIITALLKEQQALLRHIGAAERLMSKNRIYYKALIPHERGLGAYSVVLLSLPGMGNVQASIATTQAINVWNPSYIILTGIAGGIKKNSSRLLGDLIIGEQIVDYELGRVSDGKTERRFQVIRSAFPLVEAAHNLPAEKWALSTTVPRPDAGTERALPRVHFGIVASGEKVVADSTLAQELQSPWSELVGIEMEGYGTALAAYQAETAPGMLMIKGICDWADSSKNDEWQEYAADVAAAFVVALLKIAPFALRKDRPQAVTQHPNRHSGRSKIKLCRQLGDDWRDLADYFDVPPDDRAAFTSGRECQDLWDWLDARKKMDGLGEALMFIERADLIEAISENV